MKDVVNDFLVVVFQDFVSDQFIDGFGIITAMSCEILFINADHITKEDLFHAKDLIRFQTVNGAAGVSGCPLLKQFKP